MRGRAAQATARVLLFAASVTQANRRAYDGVFRYARAARWDVQTIEYALAARLRGQSRAGGLPDVRGLVDLWKPDGAIVECGGRPTPLPLDAFGARPVVLLDCDPVLAPGAVCVYTDADAIAKAAARELLALGFGDYAYAPFADSMVWSRARGACFARLVRMSGRRFHALPGRGGGRKGGGEAPLVASLIPHVRRLPRPCGVFAANDAVARAVISACAAAGVSVPDEVAVAGVDNDEQLCENASISLSSVRIDHERAGYQAAALLAQWLASGAPPASAAFGGGGLTRRASTRRLRTADVRVARALEYIRRHACAGITPADVVREMGCSRRLADLRFGEATGGTLLDEIHAVRLARVKSLLANAQQHIAAIPDLCGYRSLPDLCRDFKKRTGLTLRQWRTMFQDVSRCFLMFRVFHGVSRYFRVGAPIPVAFNTPPLPP